MKKIYDCVIIGGGPAGLNASLYCARANLNCAIIDKTAFGGTLINYLEIENYLGFSKIDTVELSERFENHIEKFDIKKHPYCEINDIDLISPIKKIKTSEGDFLAKSVIIATGAKSKKLNIKGEKECISRGVSYCSVCDGSFYKGKIVSVIGGGNTSLESALYLSNLAKKVYLIHRRDSFRADKIIQDRVKKVKNIEIIYNTIVDEILYDSKVNAIKVINKLNNKTDIIKVDGVFPCIGLDANTELFSSQLKLDKDGFIITDCNMKTNIDGVYAIGDIRNTPLRQVITAVSDGAIAGLNVNKYCMNFDNMEVVK